MIYNPNFREEYKGFIVGKEKLEELHRGFLTAEPFSFYLEDIYLENFLLIRLTIVKKFDNGLYEVNFYGTTIH